MAPSKNVNHLKAPPDFSLMLGIPREVQVHMLSFLRAYDLSAVAQTCRAYHDPDLMHQVITFQQDFVYTRELTIDIVQASRYTLSHLRTMELTVVARVLSRPEPKTGFYVSKSWVKKTLLWLETLDKASANTAANNNTSCNSKEKKLSKKQQRQRARRLSDVSPPWPDANSDLLCCHQQLARCSSAKSARARRKLLDKNAWKILKRLYPDSTQLEQSSGECLQCVLETETNKKNEQDRQEQAKLERKKPLANSVVRRLYTRSRGFPTDCMRSKPPMGACPLEDGMYVVIPRVWFHQWRRYLKTGDGGMPLPPESSALLCDAHKLALLPPHLEAFLNGEISQLLSTTKAAVDASMHTPAKERGVVATLDGGETSRSPTPSVPPSRVPVGVQPQQPILDMATLNAMYAAGMSDAEVATQRMAMLQLEQHQNRRHHDTSSTGTAPTPGRGSLTMSNQTSSSNATSNSSNNDLLDQENHVVVELVSMNEWQALHETGCWPKPMSHFCLQVEVSSERWSVSTLPCRECDPTGSRFQRCAQVQYRRKRWEPKCVEQKRIPHVEY